MFYVLPCVILFLCFLVLLALRLPLGKERANLSIFLTFVRFVLVCRFPIPLGVWEGLRFVIVKLTGLFSYLFCLFPLPLVASDGLQFVIVTLPGLFSYLVF